MSEEELASVRGMLKNKQEKARLRLERQRMQHLASRDYGGGEFGAAEAAAGGCGGGRRGDGGGGVGGGIISLEAFVEFAL